MGLNVTLPVEVTVDESPEAITLHFLKPSTNRAFTIWRKAPHDVGHGAWGEALVTTAEGASSWTDTAVKAGVEYEYRVREVLDGAETDTNSYLLAGIAVDKTDWRGRVVVVVEESIPADLPELFKQYKQDITGDGWTVHVVETPTGPRNGTGNLHQPVKEAIQAVYNAHPGELKQVVLLGSVPQPRSGIFSFPYPDGHGNRAAAGSDAYYAEMDDDGFWTDTEDNSNINNIRSDQVNVPGDGKFDPEGIPNNGDNEFIELGFGRVDFAAVDGSLAATRNYLEKLHDYRHAQGRFANMGRGALLRGGGFASVAEPFWNDMPGIVGLDNLEYFPDAGSSGLFDYDSFLSRQTGPHLFHFRGNGAPGGAGEGAKAVFWTGFQSNWGYWYQSSAMWERMAEDSMVLSFTWSTWSWRYHYHRMGMGNPIGDMMKSSINVLGFDTGVNQFLDDLYPLDSNRKANGDYTGFFIMNHMGDPLLRAFMLETPEALTAERIGTGVRLQWEPSPAANLAGYHVYRAPDLDTPFVRLTGTPVSGTAFADGGVDSGSHVYMVRAVRLETTGGGSFLNGSTGIFVEIDLDATGATPLAVASTELPNANWNSPYAHALTAEGGVAPYHWSLAPGSTGLPAGLRLTTTGLLQGTPQEIYDDSPTFRVTDAGGNTAERSLGLFVDPAEHLSLVSSADAALNPDSPDSNDGFATRIGSGESLIKFDLGGIADASVASARLILSQTQDNRAPVAGDEIPVTLTADTDDDWKEVDVTYASRPANHPSLATLTHTFAGDLSEGDTIEIDVTAFVNETLANDPQRILSLHFGDVTAWRLLTYGTRENFVASSRPRLILESTESPSVIELVEPARQPVRLAAPGNGSVLALKARAYTRSGSASAAWSVLREPVQGSVSFADSASLASSATFAEPGSYLLELAVSDPLSGSVTRKSVEVQVGAGSFPGGPLPDLAWFRFDERDGTAIVNHAGDADAQIVDGSGSLDLAPGKFGQALDFSGGGGDSYLLAGTHGDYPLAADQSYTISFWIKDGAFSEASVEHVPLTGKATANGGAGEDFALLVDRDNGKLRGRIGGEWLNAGIDKGPDGDADTDDDFPVEKDSSGNIGNASVLNTDWRHVALVYDAKRRSYGIYQDGGFTQMDVAAITETDARFPVADGVLDDSSIADWLFGGIRQDGNSGFNGGFTGMVDDLRLYGRALSADEVFAIGSPQPLNQAPSASITTPISGSLYEPITLSASFSDGETATHHLAVEWTCDATPGTFALDTTTLAAPVFTGYQPGDYTLRLTISDGQATTVATATVSVGSKGPLVSSRELSMNENGDTANFDVTLASAPATDVVLQLSVDDPNIAGISPATLTFAPSNWDQPQTVTVTGGTASAPTSTTTLRIAVDPDQSDATFVGSPEVGVAVEVANLDSGFTLSETAVAMLESGEVRKVRVTLDSRPSSAVVFDLTSSDVGQVSVFPAQLTLEPEDFPGGKVFEIVTIDNAVRMDNPPAEISIAVNPALSDAAFDTLADQSIAVLMEDDDQPGVSVTPFSLRIEEGATSTFLVRLDAAPVGAVVLNITSSDSDEATVSPATLDFTSSNWNRNQMVTVTAIEDSIVQIDHSATITVSVDTVLSDEYFDSIPDVPIPVSLINNDFEGFVQFTSFGTYGRDEAELGTLAVGIERTEGASGDVQVDVRIKEGSDSAVEGEDYLFTPQTVTWADGDDEVKYVTVEIIDDDIPERKWENFRLQLVNLTGAAIGNRSEHYIEILNDDFQDAPGESFEGSDDPFDLEGKMIVWQPDGMGSYTGGIIDINAFPNDPSDGILVPDSSTNTPINLPNDLTLPYYGTDYDSVTISPYGFAFFGPGDFSTRWDDWDYLFGTWIAPPLIALYWDNLDPSLGGEIRYQIIETEGEERLVVSYIGVPERSGDPAILTGQMEIWKDGRITLSWLGMDLGSNNARVTIGLGTGSDDPLHGASEIDLSNLPPPGLTILNTGLAIAEVDAPYSHLFNAGGGLAPFAWTLASGTSLPGGLALDPTTGELAGTPATAGTYAFTLQVTDAESETTSTEIILNIISATSDIDGNALLDQWELEHFGSLGQDPTGDPDDDGADNLAEQNAGSDPNQAHSDGDGVSDGIEIVLGRNPSGLDRIAYDFLDDFERGPGVLPDFPSLWSVGSGATAEIKAAIGAGGSHGLEILAAGEDPAELTLHLPGHWRAVSWKQFDAILVPFNDDADTPSVDADAAVAFYLTEGGDLRIRDGADWYALGLTLDTAAMHRYTVRQDYIAQTWKLWVDGGLVVDPPAAFANPRSAPAFVRLSHPRGDEPAVFDNFTVTGTPQDASGLAGLGTFDAWSGGHAWGGADGTATADPNANGLPNLLEYAFGFADPMNGTHAYSTAMSLEESGLFLTLTYRRNRDAEDLAFTVQTSPDLVTWTDLEPGTADVTITPSPDTGVDHIAVKVPMTADHLFVRLRVSGE